MKKNFRFKTFLFSSLISCLILAALTSCGSNQNEPLPSAGATPDSENSLNNTGGEVQNNSARDGTSPQGSNGLPAYGPKVIYEDFKTHCSKCHDQLLKLDFIKLNKVRVVNNIQGGRMPPRTKDFAKSDAGKRMLAWINGGFKETAP